VPTSGRPCRIEVGSLSVNPFPVTPEPEESTETDQAPRLHLVPTHEHQWRLFSVEYDDAFEVRRYECETCGDILFR
jgi:hypothetical protein